MNIKAAYKYQMHEYGKSMIIFYAILALLGLIGVIVAFTVSTENVSFSTGNMVGAPVIFAFVIGLCSFKEPFGMMVQNSVSRRSFFTGKVLAVLSVGAIMALLVLLERALVLFLENLFLKNLHLSSADMVVNGLSYIGFKDAFSIDAVLYMLSISFTLYISLIAFGLFLAIVFYRLNKAGKLLVGIGVPALFAIVLPLVDVNLTNGRIYAAIGKALDFCFGITSGNLYAAVITLSVVFVVCAALFYLLLRKAQVKE